MQDERLCLWNWFRFEYSQVLRFYKNWHCFSLQYDYIIYWHKFIPMRSLLYVYRSGTSLSIRLFEWKCFLVQHSKRHLDWTHRFIYLATKWILLIKYLIRSINIANGFFSVRGKLLGLEIVQNGCLNHSDSAIGARVHRHGSLYCRSSRWRRYRQEVHGSNFSYE